MLIWCLVWCLSCLHSYHIFSPLQNHVYVLLNTSLTNVSILARHKPLLSRFSGFSQYLSTHSPIHQAKFLNFLSTRYIEVFLPSTPLDLLRFCSRHLLNTSSIYWEACFYIYLRFEPVHFHLKHFNTFLFSLDPNPFFSQKSFFPSRF